MKPCKGAAGRETVCSEAVGGGCISGEGEEVGGLMEISPFLVTVAGCR